MIEAKQAVKAYQKVSESFAMQEDKVKQEHAKKKTQLDKLESVRSHRLRCLARPVTKVLCRRKPIERKQSSC
jgi:hypothetical protein